MNNNKLQQARDLLERAEKAEGRDFFASYLLAWVETIQEYLEEQDGKAS